MRLRDALPPVALCLLGLCFASWPMLTNGFALMECDPADTRHLNYVLEHDWRWLLSPGHVSLWNPPFFWPERNVAAFTELMLAVMPFYGAWRSVGLAPDSAFQAWMLTVLALNYLCGWLLFRRALDFDPVPAAIGAFVVAFGSARMASLNHQHLLPFFFTLIALHALVRLFKGGSAFWVAVLCAALVEQLYACLVVGWFVGFWLALALGWALVMRDTRAQVLDVVRSRWLSLGIAAVLSAAALLPLLAPYRAAAAAAGARSFDEAWRMVPQLQSWLYVGPHSVVWGALAETSLFSRLPMEGEHRIGVGLVTTAVMVVMLRREPWLRVLGATALTVVVLATLYRGRVSPWAGVMAVVPGADGIRAVGRIGMLMLVPAAVALAVFAQRARRLGWLVLAFCVAEQLQRVPDAYPKQPIRDAVTRVAAAVPRTCRAFFYAVHGEPKFDEKTQLDAMWAALDVGVPTVNGYSSHFPRGWDLLEHGVAGPADETRLREALARWAASRGVAMEEVCWVDAAPAP